MHHHRMVSIKISLKTYILVLVFATGSWSVMNGIWVELPNLINETPEGWKLASYLTVICQLANIGPLLYSITKNKVQDKRKFERRTIYFIFLLGSCACFLLAFLWKNTSVVMGHRYSTYLLVLVYLVSLVDCTSSVTFLPFMVLLPAVYMSPFYIGESLSGFVPSLFALAQGIDIPKTRNMTANGTLSTTHQTLAFSQMAFFLMLSVLMLVSFLCFVGVTCKVTYSGHVPVLINSNVDEIKPLLETQDSLPTTCITYNVLIKDNVLLLMCSFWLSFLQNGILSATSSYTLAPYGTLTYHLATNLSTISSGFFSFIYLWLPSSSLRNVGIYSALYTMGAAYMLLMAVMSPHPLMVNETAGRIIIVFITIISSGLISYSKVSIASIMHLQNSEKLLFYVGIAYQAGSFIGAILAFVLVNYTSIFKTSVNI